MGSLNEQQLKNALQVLSERRGAPDISWETHRQRVEMCKTVAQHELRPLIDAYLTDRVTLTEFKSKVQSMNSRRDRLWGFKGPNGQLFFNLLVKAAEELAELLECDGEIKAALPAPPSDDAASRTISGFAEYVKGIRERCCAKGVSRGRCPQVRRVLFFLSYFWHIQDFDTWPIYYPNSVQRMEERNVWQRSGDLAKDYLSFKQVHEELRDAFTRETGEPFDHRRVTNVLRRR
jgi:hypothetical protein